eukprot:Rmarinus@m.4638
MAKVFDRLVKTRQKDIAAVACGFDRFHYLRDEIANRLVDRLEDIVEKFPIVAEVGSGHGSIQKALASSTVGVRTLLSLDISRSMLRYAKARPANTTMMYVQCDEETLPLRENCVDAAISNLALHWVNDLPGTLTKIRKSLKPNGVFIGAMLGGDTLEELRIALTAAELERDGGVSVRVSPMVQSRDVGSLMQRAGFRILTGSFSFSFSSSFRCFFSHNISRMCYTVFRGLIFLFLVY